MPAKISAAVAEMILNQHNLVESIVIRQS